MRSRSGSRPFHPSVRVGFGTGLPPTGEFLRVSFVLNNAANDRDGVAHGDVGARQPGYFDAANPVAQWPAVHGCRLGDASSSVILNREAAKRFFGNDDPIGRTLPFGKHR